jgi:FMN-dependent NADH-azoreductase
MQSILFLSCSPKGSDSISTRFAEAILARLCDRHPDACVSRRDLAAQPVPLIDASFSKAILTGDDNAAALAPSEHLIQELEAADAVVLATPMHNYGPPAVLKAWIDQVVRIRRTFAPTPAGKIGLLQDRPVFVVIASGGWFSRPSPNGAPPQPDFLTPYLKAIFATIGLSDIRIITLEGITRGETILQDALTAAHRWLDTTLPA